MAPRGFEAPPGCGPRRLRRRAACAGLLALLVACSGAPPPAQPPQAARAESAPGPTAGPQQLLQQAEELTAAGAYDRALEALLRLQPARGGEDYPRYVWLRARIALAQQDAALAAHYARELVSTEGEAAGLPAAHQLLGDLSYSAGDHGAAFEHYLQALTRSAQPGSLPASVYLRLAEIALYERADREAARQYLGAAPLRGPAGLDAAESAALGRMTRRLRWSTLEASALGLQDGNVSALAADGADLWVGTWNGAVARYSAAQGRPEVLREGRQSLNPNTVRCLAVTPARVWIGTYQGLFVYSKASSEWQEVERFGGASPVRVEAVLPVGERVFVGTLGNGLWVLERGSWRRLSAGALPGEHVTCLLAVEGQLLIGTMSMGLLLYNLSTGSLRTLDSVQPGLEARNLTTLLHEPPASVWIGTYGAGLYRWDRQARSVQHFSRAGGELSDDWVLCGVRAADGLFFGTFGGGVSRFADGRWSSVGLREGLAALDVSAAAYLPPLVCFGTLGFGVSVLDESVPDFASDGAGAEVPSP